MTKWRNQFGAGDTNDPQKSVWGKKLLGGVAGLKFTAKQIVEEFPRGWTTYVEPFAGMARTCKEMGFDMCTFSTNTIVLNDLSPHSNEYCKKTFPIAIVENMSFEDTINKYDSDKTFFFIDPPWRHNIYTYNDFFRMDRKVYDYYKKLLEMTETMKGDWMITSNADEHECRKILTKSKWNTKLISSGGKHIFGKPAKTLLCSNLFGLKEE